MNIWNSLPGKLLMTFFISMAPVVELRGAIPIATANGLAPLPAIAVAVIGNLLPVPFLILFIEKIFAWLRTKSAAWNRFVTRQEARARKKAATVQTCAFWGLFAFVAVPLPGTGAWTGSLIAAMLHLPLRRAFPAIALGVVTAGLVVAFVSYGAGALLMGI